MVTTAQSIQMHEQELSDHLCLYSSCSDRLFILLNDHPINYKQDVSYQYTCITKYKILKIVCTLYFGVDSLVTI